MNLKETTLRAHYVGMAQALQLAISLLENEQIDRDVIIDILKDQLRIELKMAEGNE